MPRSTPEVHKEPLGAGNLFCCSIDGQGEKHITFFYSNIIYITCLIHSLHRVAEKVRLHFPLVNQLISSVKKDFKSIVPAKI